MCNVHGGIGVVEITGYVSKFVAVWNILWLYSILYVGDAVYTYMYECCCGYVRDLS